ncbi:hypothetical protein JYQ62_17735 [Nostoc sp. UHCC 0702]|nr:hypothetical protein JYQ62_17735 [Nostoc sp. UHCC 0702]
MPNPTNRGLIEKALEDAVKDIRNDDSIQVEPVIDRDTVGVPGSPDIAHTIFGKIEQAQVFVCDISIINQNTSSRSTPNPNVLIELGYAIKALGWDNIIMVINSAFGKPEELPFDLRMRRVITYHMPKESEDRATERKKLEKTFTAALRSILEGLNLQTTGEIVQPLSIGEQVRIAVENSQPNQVSLIRRFMTWLRDELDALKPDFTTGGILDELLFQSIERTKDLVIEFALIAELIATMNNYEAAESLYKEFSVIIDCYNPDKRTLSGYLDTDFDFYKFIGHELFVTLFAFLIRENRWEIIADILDQDIYIENSWKGSASCGSGMVTFIYVSEYIELLDTRKSRLQLSGIPLHPDILNKRHTQGKLGKIAPMQQIMDADCFLFLRSEFQDPEASKWHKWIPWTRFCMQQIPRFLLEAQRVQYAQRLLRPLGLENIQTLQYKLAEGVNKLANIFPESCRPYPFSNFDSRSVASR